MRRPHITWNRLCTLFVLLSLGPTVVRAQDADARKPLRVEDYDRWSTVTEVALSDDGTWMTYAYHHRVSDDTLRVASLSDGPTFTGFPDHYVSDLRFSQASARRNPMISTHATRRSSRLAAILRATSGRWPGWRPT